MLTEITPRSQKRVSRTRAWALVVLCLAVISSVTLLPGSGPNPQRFSACLLCGDLGGVDVFWNVLLFIPLGVVLALAGVQARRAIFLVCLATLCIEVLQLGIVSGRDPSLSDLLTNTIGGALGFTLTQHARQWLFPSRRAAGILAVMATIGVGTVLVLSAMLMRPSLLSGDYYAQWAPRQPQFATFGGTILDLRIDGAQIPVGVLGDREVYQRALREGRARVRAEIVSGEATSRLSAIGRAANFRAEAFLLGQTRHDLVVRFRLRAVNAGLRTPTAALPDAFPVAGERATIEGWMRDNRIHAKVTDRRGERMASVALSPALGWSLVLPFSLALPPGYLALSALWLALLAIPAGYWSGWLEPSRSLADSRSARSLVVLGVSLAGGLALSADLARLPMPSIAEFAGVLGGALAGWFAARLVIRRASRNRGHLNAPEQPGTFRR